MNSINDIPKATPHAKGTYVVEVTSNMHKEDEFTELYDSVDEALNSTKWAMETEDLGTEFTFILHSIVKAKELKPVLVEGRQHD